MSELAHIIDELREIHAGNAWHGPALRESLTGVSAKDATVRVVPNAHCIWEIVCHITGWENVFRRRLQGETAAEPESGDFPQPTEIDDRIWNDDLANLDSEHEKLLQLLEKFTDSSLDQNVPQRDYTVRFLLHGIIRHHVYHAGQIGLLRKAFT